MSPIIESHFFLLSYRITLLIFNFCPRIDGCPKIGNGCPKIGNVCPKIDNFSLRFFFFIQLNYSALIFSPPKC